MQILRVAASFSRISSGLEPNVYYLSKLQARQGHEVWVATGGTPGITEMDGFAVIRFREPRMPRWLFGLKGLLSARRAGVRPDVVHGLNPLTLGWMLSFAKKRFKSKYVLSLHGSYRHGPQEFARLSLYLARHVDAVIAVSPFITRDLVSDGIARDRLWVIPSGVDEDLFRYSPPPTDGPTELLYVGSFRTIKRVDLIVRAFSDLRLKMPSCRLVLVGGSASDEGYGRVLRLVRALELGDSVSVLAPVSHFQMPAIYARSSVVLLSSEMEGLGKTLLEAGSAGRPSVAPKIGGIPYVVRDGVNGRLYSPGNLRALEKTIEELLCDQRELAAMGRKGRRIIERNFTWSRIAKKYTELFESLCKARAQ